MGRGRHLMIGALAGLGTGLANLAGKWIKNRGEQQAAKHETAMAVEGRKKELAQEKGRHDAAWELSVLQQPPDRMMRRTLGLLILSPVFVAVLWPARGVEVWNALRLVPTEYWLTVGVVFGFYFATKNAPVFFGKLGQALGLLKRKPASVSPAPATEK